MSVVEVKQPPTLRMINATEAKSPAEWRTLYPDLWLLLEVTQKDEWEVYQVRLIATAQEDIELVDLARAYAQQEAAYMITRGQSKEEEPYLVAGE